MLIDTSVWIDHLRHGNDRLATLLNEGQVLCHPFVIGELSCGNLKQRARVLHLLTRLPPAPQAEHAEVLALVESRHLAGRGIGWIDAHLLASTLLGHTLLWTLDKRLAATARSLKLLATP